MIKKNFKKLIGVILFILCLALTPTGIYLFIIIFVSLFNKQIPNGFAVFYNLFLLLAYCIAFLLTFYPEKSIQEWLREKI
jgi:hypothetical protein